MAGSEVTEKRSRGGPILSEKVSRHIFACIHLSAAVVDEKSVKMKPIAMHWAIWNHDYRKCSRQAGRRRKFKSGVPVREYACAVPVRVTQHCFKNLDPNLRTCFLSNSYCKKGHSSSLFEAEESCEIPLLETVDSAPCIQKSRRITHGRRYRRRGKGFHYEHHNTYSSLQPQSYFGLNHSFAIQIRENGKESEKTNDFPLPAAKKLRPSAENEKHCLVNTAFHGSRNVFVPSEVHIDNKKYSGISTYVKEINLARMNKIKYSMSEFHENDNTDAEVIPDNISCSDNKMDSTFVAVEKALRSPCRKKLLVLDLNGILCDVVFGSHGSRLPYKKVSLRSVFKRPFLDEFLAFCFERFAVGIWSSRNKNNIIGVINYVMGDSKDRLLFCWDQSKCTFTGFNTIENRHKPLVLKELMKLWDKEEANLPWEKGEYSPSNTLLVDDSPYKALSNPLHTAIFPYPYDFRDEGDGVLGPGGAIRVYLESIAMADDVRDHVKKHSFGQQAITSEHKSWSFYKNIINNNDSIALIG